MPGLLYCPGDLVIQGGTPVCSVDWAVAPYHPPFDLSQIDPALMGQMFIVGFTLVATFLVLPMPVRMVYNFIRNL